MRPLGRFFQVTETLDFKKYFLDIDKVQRFPVSFVVKTKMPHNEMIAAIKDNAIKSYKIKSVVQRYMDAVEEIINIDDLTSILMELIDSGGIEGILSEIILQRNIKDRVYVWSSG